MSSVLFPVGVFGLALTMLVAHRRSWRIAQARALDAVDRAYRRRQFVRRVQASSLLALVAPAMFLGGRIEPAQSPRLFVALWGTIVVVTCWVGWLAILDALASTRHFHRLGRERAAARQRLRKELHELAAEAHAASGRTPEIQAESANGRPKASS
jgi:hypothetical protein